MVGLVRGKEAKRKTFVARADLLDKLSEVADARGYSLYALVNEVFELFLKAGELGVNLQRIIEERGVLENAKRAGFVLGLESLWYSMADLAYQQAKNRAIKEWFEAGVWFAKRYATACLSDPIKAIRRDLETFMWNISQFSMDMDGEKISIKILGPRFSQGYTLLLVAFLEGLLRELGFGTVEREVFQGNIRVEALKKGKADGQRT